MAEASTVLNPIISTVTTSAADSGATNWSCVEGDNDLQCCRRGGSQWDWCSGGWPQRLCYRPTEGEVCCNNGQVCSDGPGCCATLGPGVVATTPSPNTEQAEATPTGRTTEQTQTTRAISRPTRTPTSTSTESDSASSTDISASGADPRPSSTSLGDNTDASTSDDGLSTGAKAGIGVGVAAIVLIALLVAFLVFRQRKKNKRETAAAGPAGGLPGPQGPQPQHYPQAAQVYGAPPANSYGPNTQGYGQMQQVPTGPMNDATYTGYVEMDAAAAKPPGQQQQAYELPSQEPERPGKFSLYSKLHPIAVYDWILALYG
ncbi:hypothetical protein M501DRAFT_985680 [Patellaria atrata CBS 101060]|uniref:Uncharacterized protein n=1 Tax=Patellaria atrata CBS 101060 TaxID=1346257 RepID=A0A9P4SKM9_9PEZI|nr:hypothetical protein M501DRAFT_985680 [Patellaria atrata CBS 101060]